MSEISRQQLIDAYKQACEIELQAFKPGNVSVYSEGHDMTVNDFRVSAEVSAAAITHPDYCLGEKIFYAVKATREAVGCNTNLGIVLLCAPLLQAAAQKPATERLRDTLKNILQNTTVYDAEWVFKAIKLASPGGLGESQQHDVRNKAEVTLIQAMQTASQKDRIALQYVTNFKDIFDFAILRYNDALILWGNQKWATVAVFIAILSRYPDSHIERKYGNLYSGLIDSRMELLEKELSNTSNPKTLEPKLYIIDQEFKDKGINPGTTADMTVATALLAFLQEFTQY